MIWRPLRSAERRAWWIAALKPARERMHWGKVRAFGELAILSRASNAALIGVPLLAALWPALRDVVQWIVERQAQLASTPLGKSGGVSSPLRTPEQAYLDANLPWIWGALFFAALLAVIGRVLYQSHCPQLIKEHSREDLITKRKEEFQRLRESDAASAANAGSAGLPDDAKAHLSLLEDALKLIQEAGTDATLSAFRHPNLVSVNGRTYWLPNRVDDFGYKPVEVDHPADVAARRVREKLEPLFPRLYADTPEVHVRTVETAPAAIPRTRREIIAIMAGADAEFDTEARRNLPYAYLSRWCYVLATVLIGIVLWFQGSLIFWEMGAGVTTGRVAAVHQAIYWSGTNGLLYLLAAAWVSIIIWILLSAIFGEDPLPDPDTIKWQVRRKLRRS